MPSNPENYGEVFKDLRIDRGIREKEAYKDVCSRSTLCRFEAGISNIGLSTLVGLLENIGVSTEEYFAAVKDYELSVNEVFFQKLNKYDDDSNVDMLKEMLEELYSSKNKYDSLKILMLKTMINNLDKNFVIYEQDIINASDYLIGLDQYGYNEMDMLINIIDKLNINLACSITRELIRARKKFLINEYRKIQLVKLLLNVSYSCIKHEHLSNADIFLEEAESLIATQRIDNSIAERYVLRFIKGYYYLIYGEEEIGINLIEKALNNFKTTEDKGIIERYEKYYEEVMTHAKRSEKIKIN